MQIDLEISERQRDTTLAALRFWQHWHQRRSSPSKAQQRMIWDIANGDHDKPLSPDEIDELCEHINLDATPAIMQGQGTQPDAAAAALVSAAADATEENTDDELEAAARQPLTSEPTNEDRAERARAALEAYRAALGDPQPDESHLRDLLCDLMHLARVDDLQPFDEALESARGNFDAELDPEDETVDGDDGAENLPDGWRLATSDELAAGLARYQHERGEQSDSFPEED